MAPFMSGRESEGRRDRFASIREPRARTIDGQRAPSCLRGNALARCGAARGAVVRLDEVGYARRDLGAETGAVEHPIVSDVELQVMRLLFLRDADAQALRRFGLPDAGNIVVLSFDREKRDIADLGGLDRHAAMRHLAF